MKNEFDLDWGTKKAETVKKDLQTQKTEGGIFNREVLDSVGKLGSEGFIDRIMGPISTGKEADVFLGEREGKKIAIKIFRLSSASYFRNPTVLQYILGDERFKKVRQNARDLIASWVLKEYKNLKKVEEAGVRAPRALAIEKNVIVMDFIGDNEAAPQLLRAKVDDMDAMFKEILTQVKKMYASGLVHADLSEYNVLVHEGKPYLIDFAQGVLLTHPKAEEFLERDVTNICAFFNRRGVRCDAGEVLKKVKSAKKVVSEEDAQTKKDREDADNAELEYNFRRKKHHRR